VLELRVQMTVSLDSTVVSLMGVMVIVVEEEPLGMVVDVPMDVKSEPEVALPETVKFTLSELVVAPVRVTVKIPASGPVSEAFASVALIVTVGNVGVSLSAMLTVALLVEPTV
jgi:hypothetical protein